jgi:hypothetical protein
MLKILKQEKFLFGLIMLGQVAMLLVGHYKSQVYWYSFAPMFCVLAWSLFRSVYAK